MKQPRIWIITDTHFGHEKMVEYCGRPKNHSELILENLKVIQDGDTLIHLGDVCIGDDSEWHEKFHKGMIGVTRIRLRGNHDKKSDNWYLNHGWHFVCEEMSNHYFGKYITFSHEPIPHIQNTNIHGHFHNNLHRLLRKEFVTPDEEARNMVALGGMNSNHKLIAIEETNYKPVLLNSLLTPLSS